MTDVSVELIPVSVEHTDLILQWRADPVVAESLFSPRPPTREEHLAWLKNLGEKRREYVICAFPGKVPIGTIGLSQIDQYHHNAEYGILIGDDKFRGRGYAMAASRHILRIAFVDLHLHRVGLRVMAKNDAALKLYERAGFKREGLLRENVMVQDRYEDVVLMGILEAEWRNVSSHL